MRTPWGKADHIEDIGPEGIKQVSTPGHGGIFVPKALFDTMQEKHRSMCTLETAKGGWFEEDLDFIAVVRAFPQWFDAGMVEYAGKDDDDLEDEK